MKTRIISAIVMCIIVIPVVLIGGLPFKILAVLLSIASMYEMLKARSSSSKIPLLIRIFSYILIAAFVYFGNDLYSLKYEFIYKILIIVFLIYLLPVVLVNDTEKYSVADSLYILGTTVFLGVVYNSVILVSNNSINYLLYLILITVITDTFAYFTGYFIGKRKLCEKISPNKTVEGALGGLVLGTLVPMLFYLYIIDSDINILVLAVMTLTLSAVGEIGDLFFSSLKRHYNIKDFSNLIPGHGGILDRLDSLIFVVITFVLFLGLI